MLVQVLCRFCKGLHAPRVTEGFGSLQNFNIRGLKYDDPPLSEAENNMTHPTGMAENIVTRLLCAPAHPLLYLLTSPLGNLEKAPFRHFSKNFQKPTAEARLIRAGFIHQNISALYGLPFKVTKNKTFHVSVQNKPQIILPYATNSSGLKLARMISVNPVALSRP